MAGRLERQAFKTVNDACTQHVGDGVRRRVRLDGRERRALGIFQVDMNSKQISPSPDSARASTAEVVGHMA